MRPPRPTARAFGARIAAVVGVMALLAATVAPVSAQPPGPPQIPALSGLVTDACTRLPITRGVSVGVALIDPAAPVGIPPGPPIRPPTPIFGLFAYRTLEPGTYQLTIDAPGYTSLGADPASPVGGSPGVTIIQPPGPPNLPAGQIVNQSLVVGVQIPPGPPT